MESIFILKYGSDPLSTYLPESDIDVTIIVDNNFRCQQGNVEYQPAIAQLKMLR
jgi:predicted nucleotidyltransferase